VSNDQKKTGARDISDLKARLGLKKGAPEGRPAGGSGGVPAPSAAKIGGFVPPPPGVAQPQQPAAPDAADDPFGAMNHMARQAAPVAQPQVIVVDHKDVEKVSSTDKVLRIVKVAVMIVVPLAAGLVFGRIMQQNAEYNHKLDDAGKVFKDFDIVAKSLNELQAVLDMHRPKDGKFIVGDPKAAEKLLTDLKAIKIEGQDPDLLFKSNLYNLAPDDADQLFRFYSEFQRLQTLVAEHLSKTEGELRRATRQMPEQMFAAVLHAPAEGMPYFEIVTVGGYRCTEDQKEAQPGPCPGPPAKVSVSHDLVKYERITPVAKATAELKDESVVYFGPALGKANAATQALFVGPEKWIDGLAYQKRLADIYELADTLNKARTGLQTLLNAEAKRGKRFAL
jgi:hypothetical protein